MATGEARRGYQPLYAGRRFTQIATDQEQENLCTSVFICVPIELV